MNKLEIPKITAIPTFNIPMCSETSLMPGAVFCAQVKR